MSRGGIHAHRRRKRRLARLFASHADAEVATYDVVSPRWTAPPMSAALLADLHVNAPWTSLSAVGRLVDRINAMPVDAVFLLGDYLADRGTPGRKPPMREIAGVLAGLRAPLGVHAILGNHDWKDDALAWRSGFATSEVIEALGEVGLAPLNNAARRLEHGGQEVWVVGMDSQRGHGKLGTGTARHDPEAAFAAVPEGAPAILLAHEPDYFDAGDPRPVVQLSGHTHGGQANLFGWRPFTPSSHRDRFAYGHVVEDGRHLVVSGGIGYTALPLRIAQPPEISLVRLSGGPEPDDGRETP